MVDRERRPLPAPDPGVYGSFTDWLQDALKPIAGLRGLPAMLGRYVGSENPNQTVGKWKGGSIPEFATLREIADWGQVEYFKLEKIAIAQREAKEKAKKNKVSRKKEPVVKNFEKFRQAKRRSA